MPDQPGSSRLRPLFESALQDYKVKTNITLAKHPVAEQLENCHSVESITALLQGQMRAFSDFRGSDRIMTSIKSTVSFLYELSATASLNNDAGLVCQKALMELSHVSDVVLQAFPPANAIYTGLGVLLAVCAIFKVTNRVSL